MAAEPARAARQAARLFSAIDFFGTGSRECRTRNGRRVSGVCRRPSEARRRAAARRPTVSPCPGRADRSAGPRVRAILAGCSRRSTIITEPRLSGSGCLRPSTSLTVAAARVDPRMLPSRDCQGAVACGLGQKARERGTYRVRLTNKYDVARRRSIPTAPQPNERCKLRKRNDPHS